MKLLFLANFYPKKEEKAIRKKMKFNMYDATNTLQWNIVDGMVADPSLHLTIYNHLPVDSFPSYYSDWKVKEFSFDDEDGKYRAQNIPFLNVKYIKRIFLRFPFVSRVKKWAKRKENNVILAYSLNILFLTAIKNAKRKNKKLKAFAIVADLPQFSAPRRNLLQRLFATYNTKKVQRLLAVLDGFVLLAEPMAQKLGISKPFTVMEGMYSVKNELPLPEPNNKKTVFYSGSLNAEYGILTLLSAFESLDDTYELVLCGLGNAESAVRQKAQNDPRIKYLGKIPHEEALLQQQAATVLINPRQNTGEFTKYSFPSKTMEYLASGVPVIAYKLDGIPDEYDDYLHYPKDNAPETLAALIEQLCQMPPEERKAIGMRAQLFVKEHKNNIVQTKRILDLIEALSDVDESCQNRKM